VRDPAVWAQVLEKVRGYAAENGLDVIGELESPITGTKGNREYLALMAKAAERRPLNE